MCELCGRGNDRGVVHFVCEWYRLISNILYKESAKAFDLLAFNKLSSNGGIEGNQFAQLQITGFGGLGACANWLPAGGQCRERHGAH